MRIVFFFTQAFEIIYYFILRRKIYYFESLRAKKQFSKSLNTLIKNGYSEKLKCLLTKIGILTGVEGVTGVLPLLSSELTLVLFLLLLTMKELVSAGAVSAGDLASCAFFDSLSAWFFLRSSDVIGLKRESSSGCLMPVNTKR